MSEPSGYQLRRLNCRRCAAISETPGAAYCDSCRPKRMSDALMTEHDWRRDREQLQELLTQPPDDD